MVLRAVCARIDAQLPFSNLSPGSFSANGRHEHAAMHPSENMGVQPVPKADTLRAENRLNQVTTRMTGKNRASGQTGLVSRDQVIHALFKALNAIDYIKAFWEGGALAYERNDEYSDIDAYLLVDDGKAEETFAVVESTLQTLSPIQQKYVVRQNPWPGVSQAFYKLERASEYLVLDLAILTDSSRNKFLEPEIHGTAVFYFDKIGIDQTPALDRQSFEKKMAERLDGVDERFRMFHNFVQKEIARGNSLEALEYYRTIVIPSLVEALRVKHNPMHYDFRMRYIHYELPRGVVERLEHLCFVRGREDLQTKYLEAVRWFNELRPAKTEHFD